MCAQKDQGVHTWTKHLLLPVKPVTQRAQPPQVRTSALPCALKSMPLFAAESLTSHNDVALLAFPALLLFHKQAASSCWVHGQDQLLKPKPTLTPGLAQGLDAAVVAPWQAEKKGATSLPPVVQQLLCMVAGSSPAASRAATPSRIKTAFEEYSRNH